MSTTLHPSILRKLMEFQDRRRTMIFFRGGGATVSVLLAGMFLVSALDWFTPFPDFWRYVFSGVVYLATLAVAILWLIRPLMGTPRAGEVARRIEIACPAMHEMLISAVELGDVDAGKSEDSVGPRWRLCCLLRCCFSPARPGLLEPTGCHWPSPQLAWCLVFRC